MDNFRIIYKILHVLEKAMDIEEFDVSDISAESLNISVPRWNSLMEILSDEGFVKGITVHHHMSGETVTVVSKPVITLKGLEYLHENSLMKKAANIAKGISEIIS